MSAEKTSHNGSSQYQVPNLERALTIMELLSKHPEGLILSRISQMLDISKNSVFRITATLHNRGYLVRDDLSKTFRLSDRLMAVGSAAVSESNLVEVSLDVMRELRDKTKETVLLGALLSSEYRGVTLEQVPGLHPFKFLLDVGSNLILHVGAPGKVLLAYIPDAERERIIDNLKLKRYTANTITTRSQLMNELNSVRKKGYAVDRGEWTEEMHCVGAPVLNQRNYPVAALWVTGPSSRLLEKEFDKTGEIVREHAFRISKILGFSGDTLQRQEEAC